MTTGLNFTLWSLAFAVLKDNVFDLQISRFQSVYLFDTWPISAGLPRCYQCFQLLLHDHQIGREAGLRSVQISTVRLLWRITSLQPTPEHCLFEMGKFTFRAGSLGMTCLCFMPGFHSKRCFANICNKALLFIWPKCLKTLPTEETLINAIQTKIGKSLDLAQGHCNMGEVII